MANANLHITPIDAPAGVEITGVQVAHDLGEADFAAIEAAFDAYGVLVVRDQDLTPAQQLDFAERFGATAMTLEMPYKDNKANPEPEQGWSPERCKMLARD